MRATRAHASTATPLVAPMSGRTTCKPCRTPVIEVHVDGRLVVLGHRDERGTYALHQTVGGGFLAHYAPIGERVDPPYFRFLQHECETPSE